MKKMTEESSYALRQLEDAVEDALQSDCTPEEIYGVIRSVSMRKMLYHKACARGANELLDLMNGVDNDIHDSKNWPDYTELPESKDPWGNIKATKR